LFTLGRRGVLPVSLGAVHPTRRAPSHASLWVSGLTTAIVLVSVVAMLDPVTQIYTWYSGAGAVGVILMMALTSVAVVRFGSSGPDSAAGADGVAGAGGSAVADGSAGTGGPGGRAPAAVLLATGLGGLGCAGCSRCRWRTSRCWWEARASRWCAGRSWSWCSQLDSSCPPAVWTARPAQRPAAWTVADGSGAEHAAVARDRPHPQASGDPATRGWG